MNGSRTEPHFVLLAAVSLDGRITSGPKEGSEWTSKEDKKFFQGELDRSDAVIMGRKTFDRIKRPLTPRNRIVFTKSLLFSNSQEFENRKSHLVTFHGSEGGLRDLLGRHRWERITVVGGTSIYDWFLTRNLINEIYITVEPVIFGIGKPFSARVSRGHSRLRLISATRLNSLGTLLLHYKIK